MIGRLERSSFTPWAGLFVGAAAWFAHHQGVGDTIYWDCRLGGPLLTAGWGLLAALVTAAAGWVSWQAHQRNRGAGEGPARNRSVAGIISAAAAALFILAIAFQSLAGVIVPVCHR